MEELKDLNEVGLELIMQDDRKYVSCFELLLSVIVY